MFIHTYDKMDQAAIISLKCELDIYETRRNRDVYVNIKFMIW